MRDHDTPAGGVSVLGSLDGLGDGTNLVDLEEKSIACLGLDGLLDKGRVGDSQIITAFNISRRRCERAKVTYPTIWKSEVL